MYEKNKTLFSSGQNLLQKHCLFAFVDKKEEICNPITKGIKTIHNP